MRLSRSIVATGVVAFLGLGAGREARATLGGNAASVVANEQTLRATRQVHKLASGERHDLQLPSGIVVHEYLSPAGSVYAITWHGPRKPDLRELLGPYFAQLASGEGRRRGGGHHRMAMTGTDLVIRSSGHRGVSAGRAWVPSLVPAGVDMTAASLDQVP